MTEPFTPGSWSPPPRRGPALIALAVIAMVLFATTATFLTLWLVERSDDGETSQQASPRPSPTTTVPDPTEALAAGKRLIVLVTSYDYRTIYQRMTEVLDNSTGQFAEQYERASGSLRDVVTDGKGVASGRVIRIAVAKSEAQRVELLAFVDQTVKNANRPSPRSDKTRVMLTIVERNGRWLIEKLELV
jgi:hypothetical protein